MIILWWLFMASRFSFHYVAQYSDGAKENWYQGVRTFEALKYEITRSDFKCCN